MSIERGEESLSYNVNDVSSEEINRLIRQCNKVSEEHISEGKHWAQVESDYCLNTMQELESELLSLREDAAKEQQEKRGY